MLTGPFKDGIVSSRPSDLQQGIDERPCYPRRGALEAGFTTRAPPTLEGGRVIQRINAMHLESKCEFSGILHRYIIMELSAKVALPDADGAALSRYSAPSRSRAASHAPVDYQLRAGHVAGRVERRGRARHSRYPAPARPFRTVPRFWPLRSDRSAHCSRRTPAALSRSLCR